MSRRFSNDPINLIDRIPTRDQLSAARPPQRAWGRTMLEYGAACARGAAEAAARCRRFWHQLRTASREQQVAIKAGWLRAKAAGSRFAERAAHTRIQVASNAHAARLKVTQAYDRLAEWIAKLDAAVPPPASKPQSTQGAVESMFRTHVGAVMTPQSRELAELKASILTQQQELAHVSTQLQELKALVVSQQQVLMFLGKELDTTQPASLTTVASASAKRARVVRAKPGAKERKPPQKGSSKPSLNF